MEWQYDKRVVERNIQKGIIGPKDHEKRIKGLPDLVDQVAAPEPQSETEEASAKDKS